MLVNCITIAINGIYQNVTGLTADNFIYVNVNVTVVGSYIIKSDTVNGFTFTGSGRLGVTGNNVIRLYGSGKPLASGVSRFTVTYGTTTCVIDVTVIGPGGGAAIYTLGGAPGACGGFTLGPGTYSAGQILVAANTVLTNVNVTGLGTYDLGTDTVNGIYFRSVGVFTTAGVQSITLTGKGTPIAAGTFSYKLTNGPTTCTFSITVGGGGPPAVYALGGTPGTCTGTTLAGTYKQGQALTSANTVIVDVNVTTAGSYSLSTTLTNGVTFTANGTFGATGAQTVTLTGSGTPTAAGLKTHTINGASTTCSFDITYGAPPPPASYTLSGAPGNCAPMSVNGTYTAGTALNATNTIDVEVNVTVVGAYTLTTGAAVNGMTFSSTGTFATTGLQNVTLQGSGTPTAAATSTITPQIAASSCTVDVVVGAPADFLYKFTIGATTYQGVCSGIIFTFGTEETLNVYSIGGSAFDLNLHNAVGSLTTGAYSGTSTTGKYVDITYMGSPTFASFPGSGLTNLSAQITSINTTTRIIQGTFSGTVMDISTTGILNVTNGEFKCDY